MVSRIRAAIIPIWSVICMLLLASQALAANVTYTYDQSDRLIQEAYDNGLVINHAYDSAGNRLSREVVGATSGLTLISPNGGEQWQPGSAETIYWSYTQAAGATVKVELMKAGNSNTVLAAAAPVGSGGSGSLKWTVPANQLPGSDYKIKITSTANTAISDSSAGDFTIDAPSVFTFTAPAGGERWASGTSQTIGWTYAGDPGSTVKIELLKAGVLQSVLDPTVPIGSSKGGSFSWAIGKDQPPGNDYQIRITALAGGQTKTSNKFSILGGFTVTTPYTYSQWEAGTTNTIYWSYTGNPGAAVKIELLKADAVQSTITSSTPVGNSGSGSYAWAIPVGQAAGNDYKIRITSTTNSAFTGTSETAFTIKPTSITVTYPYNGSSLEVGSTYNINWSYVGNPGAAVKIELLKAGALLSTITSSTPVGSYGSGSYSWAIPGTQASGNDYKIRITSTTSSVYTDTSDQPFTILPTSITVTSPYGGDLIGAGSTYTIGWNYVGNPGAAVKIELLKAGALLSTITSSTPIGSNGRGSYSWAIPVEHAGGADYKIRVTSTTNSAYTDSSDTTFTIQPTVLTLSYPNGWENLNRGTTNTISWQYTGTPGASVKLELLKNGAVASIIAPSYSAGSYGFNSYSWPIPADIAVGYDYKIRITSTTNSKYTDTSDNTFSIGPSSIIVQSPNGSNRYMAGSNYTINWSYTGNPGSLVKIELLGGSTVVGTIASNISIGNNGSGSFLWPIPITQAPRSDYRIRITSTTTASCVDTSDRPFTISPPVFVYYPNGGEQLQAGRAQYIYWDYAGNPGTAVKIELLKAGVLYSTITSSTPIGTNGLGSYSWEIPAGHATGADFKIRVTSTTNAAYTSTSAGTFTIRPNSITVTYPYNGSRFVAGTTCNITWGHAGEPGAAVKIELLKAGVLYSTIASSTPIGNPGSFSYGWVIPMGHATGTDFKIRVTSTTNATYSSTSEGTFAIIPSSIAVTYPYGGSQLQAGTTCNIYWDYEGDPGAAVKIELLKAGVLLSTLTSSTPIGSYGRGSYSWAIPFGQKAGTDYKIRITSTTNATFTDTTDESFTIKPSSITVLNPYEGSDLPTGKSFAVHWSYAGNPGTTVRIDLLKGDAFEYTIASAPIGSNGSGTYTWAVPLRQASGEDYRIRLTSNTNYTGTSYYFGIVPTALTITAWYSGMSWAAGTTQQICWTSIGNPGSTVRIELYKDGVLNKVLAASAPIGNYGYGCLSWAIPATQAPGSHYRVKVVSNSDNAYSDTSDSDLTITAP